MNLLLKARKILQLCAIFMLIYQVVQAFSEVNFIFTKKTLNIFKYYYLNVLDQIYDLIYSNFDYAY